MGHAKSFSALRESQKVTMSRCRLSNDIGSQMVLTTHNLPSDRIKNDIGEVDEAVYQGVKMPCEIIFAF
jgi:hypothetical protein